MKFFKKLILLFFNFSNFYLNSSSATRQFDDYTNPYYKSGQNSICSYYTDNFGPLKTGYSMGDAMRYAVTPGLNIYSPSTNTFAAPLPLTLTIPNGVQDVKNFGQNTYNLYNALGYLYAGWLSLNNPVYNQLSPHTIATNHKNQCCPLTDIRSVWLGYRSNTNKDDANASVNQFDNNVNFTAFIPLPLANDKLILPIQYSDPAVVTNGFNTRVGYNWIAPGDGGKTISTDSFTNVVVQKYAVNWASKSGGWCPNTDNGDWIALTNIGNNEHAVTPLIQFFGGRLAHILGVIVNDVPWSTNATSGAGGNANPTPSFSSTLISGQNGKGTALPMFAAMNGGPWGNNPANAPKGMIETSTAHFGSLNTFLTKAISSSDVQSAITNLQNSQAGQINESSLATLYLYYHLQPVVSRLSQLFSYEISSNTNANNLIKIKDSGVTSMDQGVIACIQNNTNDILVVRQSSKPIGILNPGLNNLYLNTASLVSSTDGTISGTATNMIVIEDVNATKALQSTNYPVKVAT